MPLTLDALLSSPDHLLHSLDGEDAIFVPMDAAAYRRSIFLDDRVRPVRETAMRVASRTLLEAPPAAPRAIAWIFHIAHCGSTLLARALGELSGSLVLREPLALRQAALSGDPEILALVLRLLGKRYDEGTPPILKANVPVNFVIPQIARWMPGAPAVFLYYRLEDYALAILRSDNHRAWLHRICAELAPQLGPGVLRCDGERVAALWLAQLRQFGAGLATMPQARALDAERFFAEPAAVLAACARLFGLPYKSERIDAVVAGPLFGTYAKNPALAFTNADRLARRAELQVALEPELAAARAWIAGHAPDADALLRTLAERCVV